MRTAATNNSLPKLSFYRPFFLTGIITIFTLGCVWGAINLLSIGLNANFQIVKYSWILAHGHAMVFGFVGLFIMGAAYHLLPMLKNTSLWRPRLARASLPLMVVGIAIQTIAHLIVPLQGALSLAAIAAALQIAAVFIFTIVTIQTCRIAIQANITDRFVYASLFWFNVAALANFFIFKAFEFPSSRQSFLLNVATFNIPYRDVQLLGIAIVMIFGVSLSVLPRFFNLRVPSRGWCTFLFWGLNGSIVVSAITFIVGMSSGKHLLLLFQWLTAIVLLIAAIGTPFQFGLFSTTHGNVDRSLKFVRAAYLWLIVAIAMLVLVPFYNFWIFPAFTGSTTTFSHAFYGAYRHALTVGFIMMMIIGISTRIVNSSRDELHRTSSLWTAFILINLGNFTRVVTEVGTDFIPSSYAVMGFSGFVEIIGLILWSYDLISTMRSSRASQTQIAAAPVSSY